MEKIILDTRIHELLVTNSDANLQMAQNLQTVLCNGNAKRANIRLRVAAYNIVEEFDKYCTSNIGEYQNIHELWFGSLLLRKWDTHHKYNGDPMDKIDWMIRSGELGKGDTGIYYRGKSEYQAKQYMRACIKSKFKGGDMFKYVLA